MSFKREIPPNQRSADITFFGEGARLSHDFVVREKISTMSSVEIFVDDENKRIGLKFRPGRHPHALKLTKSGDNTEGRTISCAFLKKYSFIDAVMESEDIAKRRFIIQWASDPLRISEGIDYFIQL